MIIWVSAICDGGKISVNTRDVHPKALLDSYILHKIARYNSKVFLTWEWVMRKSCERTCCSGLCPDGQVVDDMR
ncbi:MAG: hypothetical protein CVV46_16280 [Spirochaetae bacterium HGW-Spirochaetae-2]|nr:MAG: hypothetical protein CVV46_16280 [Spirochaetae bacterium HGW-Spirochaetae-2]